jgi:hypothetical protein
MASYDESLRSITLVADATLAKVTGAPGLPGSATGANVAGNQYRAVVLTGAKQGGLSNANNGPVVGILQNKPQNAGNAATVAISGVSKVMTATNINAGQAVYAEAAGKGSNSNTSGLLIGRALESSTVAGSLVPVLLQLSE